MTDELFHSHPRLTEGSRFEAAEPLHTDTIHLGRSLSIIGSEPA